MVEIRGSFFNGSINAVKIRNGDQAYNEIISQLDEQARQLFEKPISDTGWYPLDSFVKFLEQDIKLTANGDENVLVTRAEAVDKKYIRDIYGSFVKSEPPEFFIKHHSILHQGYFRGVSIEIQFDGLNKAIIRYIGFEKQHKLIEPTIIGYYKKVLEISGVTDIHTKSLTNPGKPPALPGDSKSLTFSGVKQ
jgi:hypothetical protein